LRVKEIDPHYPRISVIIRSVQTELNESYVGDDGVVIPGRLRPQLMGTDEVKPSSDSALNWNKISKFIVPFVAVGGLLIWYFVFRPPSVSISDCFDSPSTTAIVSYVDVAGDSRLVSHDGVLELGTDAVQRRNVK